MYPDSAVLLVPGVASSEVRIFVQFWVRVQSGWYFGIRVENRAVFRAPGDNSGNVSGIVAGNISGDISRNVSGNMSGNVSGIVSGNKFGYWTGPRGGPRRES